jgi:transforming growth factor-beta-induced protein
MTQNTTFVTNLLEYHVLSGVFTASKFTTTPTFATSVLVSGTSNLKVELVEMTNTPMILSGFKQQSLVSQADILFSGGVIHVVDTVLTIPDKNSVTALDTGLTSLAGALVRTNMLTGVDALQGATVFAPSNSAFSAVSAVVSGTDTELLGDVLEYHIVEGMVAHSSDLMSMAMANGGTTTLRSLQGGTITVRAENGQLFVNSARITNPDVLTSNGVVHIIDK